MYTFTEQEWYQVTSQDQNIVKKILKYKLSHYNIVDLRKINLTKQQLRLLCEVLINNKFVHTVNLYSSFVDQEALVYMAELLSQNKSIIKFSISSAKSEDIFQQPAFTKGQYDVLIDALKENFTILDLKILNLDVIHTPEILDIIVRNFKTYHSVFLDVSRYKRADDFINSVKNYVPVMEYLHCSEIKSEQLIIPYINAFQIACELFHTALKAMRSYTYIIDKRYLSLMDRLNYAAPFLSIIENQFADQYYYYYKSSIDFYDELDQECVNKMKEISLKTLLLSLTRESIFSSEFHSAYIKVMEILPAIKYMFLHPRLLSNPMNNRSTFNQDEMPSNKDLQEERLLLTAEDKKLFERSLNNIKSYRNLNFFATQGIFKEAQPVNAEGSNTIQTLPLEIHAKIVKSLKDSSEDTPPTSTLALVTLNTQSSITPLKAFASCMAAGAMLYIYHTCTFNAFFDQEISPIIAEIPSLIIKTTLSGFNLASSIILGI